MSAHIPAEPWRRGRVTVRLICQVILLCSVSLRIHHRLNQCLILIACCSR